nr:hypothetical protein [Anaerolineae bacterium]
MSTTTKIVIGVLAAIAVLAIIAIAIVLVSGSGEAEPTAVAPTAAPSATVAIVDDSWERVKAAGKIAVGTSVDYPPFEFYVT